MRKIAAIILLVNLACVSAGTQEEDSLSKQLANPLAAMISVPTQINYDDDLDVNKDGSILQVNVQPVVPFELNNNRNLITDFLVNRSSSIINGVSDLIRRDI
jgi:hypothetical protein